jgi:hypothetical protein
MSAREVQRVESKIAGLETELADADAVVADAQGELNAARAAASEIGPRMKAAEIMKRDTLFAAAEKRYRLANTESGRLRHELFVLGETLERAKRIPEARPMAMVERELAEEAALKAAARAGTYVRR